MIYTAILHRNYHIKEETERKEELPTPVYHARFTWPGTADEEGELLGYRIGSFATAKEAIEACAEHARQVVRCSLMVSINNKQ
jgi:hypothetical protein